MLAKFCIYFSLYILGNEIRILSYGLDECNMKLID